MSKGKHTGEQMILALSPFRCFKGQLAAPPVAGKRSMSACVC